VKGSGSFPASLCISVNDEVVHGLPTERVIKDGDVVSLDLGAIYNGMCTDMAVTVAVGEVDTNIKKLISVTRDSLNLGISEAKAGNFIGDIGNAVQTYAEKNKFGVVRDLVGHGIGVEPHMQPSIPNFGKKGSGAEIVEGMALAIEPMLTEGNYNVKVGRDGWTVLTRDGSIAAHFEHTIVIVGGKPLVVTQ
jgi:methionyl aminopeptidase